MGRPPKVDVAPVFDCRIRDDYFNIADVRAIAGELGMRFVSAEHGERAADLLTQLARDFVVESAERPQGFEGEWAKDVRASAERLLALFDLAEDKSENAFARSCHRYSRIFLDASAANSERDQLPFRNALRGLQQFILIADLVEARTKDRAGRFRPGLENLVAGLIDAFHYCFDLTKIRGRRRREKLARFTEEFCWALSGKLVCGDIRLAKLLANWGLPWPNSPPTELDESRNAAYRAYRPPQR